MIYTIIYPIDSSQYNTNMQETEVVIAQNFARISTFIKKLF